MLVANVCELDQLPFLKLSKYKWLSEDEEDERLRIRLLENLRCLTYQYSDLTSKLFIFSKSTKKDTSEYQQSEIQQQSAGNLQLYQELHVTTEKEIILLEKFYYLLNDLLGQEEFSQMVGRINAFVAQCKAFIKDAARSLFEVEYNGRQFLTFGVYLQKGSANSLVFSKQVKQQALLQEFIQRGNKFYIKCAITNFTFSPFKDITLPKIPKPEGFEITSPIIIRRLLSLYLQMQNIPLALTLKSIETYMGYFDSVQYLVDEEYLKLQVLKNYPLLRSKYFLPVLFNDKHTGERLDGPIFSNAYSECMFGHFNGYNADTIKVLEGNNCEDCQAYFQGVQENPIMTYLRDNLFNPLKTDVMFCPQFNRFKLIKRSQTKIEKQQISCQLKEKEQQEQEQTQPMYTTSIQHLNFMHLRQNLRKMTTKRRLKFNDNLECEKFPLSFDFWGRKILILDPVRGRNCRHYEFTDLRMFYLNKVGNNRYKCPICEDQMADNEILYLRQVQILIKYLKHKCGKWRHLVTTGGCFIDHRLGKLFVEFKKKSGQGVEKEILQVKGFYSTMIDPYVSFNEYTLGIPDRYAERMRAMYLFGGKEEKQQNGEDFQFKVEKGEGFENERVMKKADKGQRETEQ